MTFVFGNVLSRKQLQIKLKDLGDFQIFKISLYQRALNTQMTTETRKEDAHCATTKYIFVQSHISEVGIFYRNLNVCINGRYMFLHDL